MKLTARLIGLLLITTTAHSAQTAFEFYAFSLPLCPHIYCLSKMYENTHQRALIVVNQPAATRPLPHEVINEASLTNLRNRQAGRCGGPRGH